MKTYELLTDEARYSRLPGQAQAALGHSVQARAPQAVRWSLSGAVAKCYELPEALRVMARLQQACHGVSGGCIDWGRKADFEEVQELLRLLDI